MKIAYIFPGQGTQVVGMGKDLYEKYEEVRNVYRRIDTALGENVENFTYDISQDELNETKNTQIAIYAMSMAILEVLNNEGIKPEMAVGLSLGEYSALVCSRALSVEEGAKIVRKRGIFMQELAPKGNWAMAAIIGLEDDKVEEVCSKVEEGFVRAVNYNCPGQVVVSGEREAVLSAIEIAKKMGARKVIELKTSGPFHTEKLEEASRALREELKKVSFEDCEIPVVKNLNGEVYNKEENLVNVLANHVISPVKFSKSIETMLDMGIDTFVEIGPGKTLSGFVKKVCKEKSVEANVLNIENVETLEKAIEILKK